MPTDDTTPGEPTAGDPTTGMRRLSGAQELRALAHPVRIALLEILGLEGSLTATEAAKIIGGTPANAAYHLRTLAKHGYVEEAEGGVGRERPWRINSIGMSFSDEDPDPAVSTAAVVLGELLVERWISRAKYYMDHRHEYPAEIREVSGNSQYVMYATTAEAEEVQKDLLRLFGRFQERLTDPATRPEGSVPFEFIVSTHPIDRAALAVQTGPAGRADAAESAESAASAESAGAEGTEGPDTPDGSDD